MMCQLTKTVLVDPVMTKYGHNYIMSALPFSSGLACEARYNMSDDLQAFELLWHCDQQHDPAGKRKIKNCGEVVLPQPQEEEEEEEAEEAKQE
jgi:hypothetical protein